MKELPNEEKCMNRFIEGGQTLLCQKEIGHAGMHESGDWEWKDAAPSPGNRDDVLATIHNAIRMARTYGDNAGAINVIEAALDTPVAPGNREQALRDIITRLRDQAHECESPYWTKTPEEPTWDYVAKAFREIADELAALATQGANECESAAGNTAGAVTQGCRAPDLPQGAQAGDSKPWLYAIEEPNGNWQDGENCVFGDRESAQDEADLLNDGLPTTPANSQDMYRVVPLYRAAGQAAQPLQREVGRTNEELIRGLVKATLELACLRNNLCYEDEPPMVVEQCAKLVDDTFNALYGIGTCSEEPCDEVFALNAALTAAPLQPQLEELRDAAQEMLKRYHMLLKGCDAELILRAPAAKLNHELLAIRKWLAPTEEGK